ncbi:hypothetical protein Tco_1085054 [Tanacetum coccineum]
MEDDKETDEHEEDDEAELKKHLVIVKDDEITIDAIPLATKPSMIVEYKLLKEGIMVHFQLIIAEGSSKRYSLMIRMLQDINREDLETLWKLVKIKHGDARPEDEHARVLLGDLKVMFEQNIRSEITALFIILLEQSHDEVYGCIKGGSGNSGGKRLAISMVEEAWLSEKKEV